jgi:hypothetical protein
MRAGRTRRAILAVAIATAVAVTLSGVTASAARRTEPNAKALAALQNANPVLEGVTTLRDFTGLSGRFLTHSGPPIDYAHMSGAQQGATWAAILFEGWASDLDSAKRLAPHIRLYTNHELDGVGGMAGVVSPSMLVYVTRDATSGKKAYSIHEYESFFGLFDRPTIDQIRFWNTVVMPTIGRAVTALKGVELNPIMADALLRGDDMHCLTTSATNGLLGVLAPAIVETSNDADAAATLKELAAFPHLAMLGIGMGASKAASMAAEGVKGSSLITVMARNGTTEGIQISAFPGRWFTVPAAEIALVPFPGNEEIKPGRDLGDSAVQEVMGRGAGSAAAAAYSGLAAEVGLTPKGMIALSKRQARISLGTADAFPILQLGHGPGLGLDARLVVRKNIAPSILTAAAAAEPGHAILGLGVSEMPVEASKKAVDALDR